ncbi:MAG TPA: hypothetical protein VGY56_10765, partial [Verrucomicrobiae bacterium]|nr:hypothetical protein [Verrucomicrobiae bacterium]
MRYRITQLRQRADWHEIMSQGTVSGDGRWLMLQEGAETNLGVSSAARGEKAAHKPNAAQVQWPLWAKTIKLLRRDGDRGIGDTLGRLFARLGIVWGVKWLGRVT